MLASCDQARLSTCIYVGPPTADDGDDGGTGLEYRTVVLNALLSQVPVATDIDDVLVDRKEEDENVSGERKQYLFCRWLASRLSDTCTGADAAAFVKAAARRSLVRVGDRLYDAFQKNSLAECKRQGHDTYHMWLQRVKQLESGPTPAASVVALCKVTLMVQDFEEELKLFRPSVTVAEHAMYAALRQQFAPRAK